jgi:hypothetical protein
MEVENPNYSIDLYDMFLDENFIQLELVDREARKQTRFEDHRRMFTDHTKTIRGCVEVENDAMEVDDEESPGKFVHIRDYMK